VLELPEGEAWDPSALQGAVRCGARAIYRIERVEVEIKGDAALYLDFTVVVPAGALQMTGGIVEAVGFAPDQPEREIRLRLVGARLREGPGAGEPIVASYEIVSE